MTPKVVTLSKDRRSHFIETANDQKQWLGSTAGGCTKCASHTLDAGSAAAEVAGHTWDQEWHHVLGPAHVALVLSNAPRDTSL